MSLENQLADIIRRADSLTVPGIGRFNLVYKPAQIDYVQKRITPPGKFLTFEDNPKLTVHDIPSDQGPEMDRSLWESTGQLWHSRLDNKETILIPNIGSIYKDFRGEVHFLPVSTNFDHSYYGLQNLPIHPVIRKSAESPNIQAVPRVPLVKTKKWGTQMADVAFSVLIGLTLIAISFGVWYAMSSKQVAQAPTKFEIAESTLEDQRKLEDILDYDAKWTQPGYFGEDSLTQDTALAEFDDSVSAFESGEDMVETSVNANPSNVGKTTSEELKSKSAGKTVPSPAAEKPEKEGGSASQISESQLKCMISVGSFSSEANALTLSKKLNRKGYTSSIKLSQNNMSRVVVLTKCSGDEQTRMLDKLKREFNPQAYIVK